MSTDPTELYPTHAVVRLDHIRHNLEAVRRQVGPRKVLVAVKANAYGHGAVEVSRMVERTGCADWLGIATIPEALELREAGIDLPILKLSGVLTPAQARVAIEHDVTLAVPSQECARLVADAADELRREVRVHLKVDTGMRRIGVEPGEAADLAKFLDSRENVYVEGLFTHLPVSDIPVQDEFTHTQIGRFFEVVDAVQAVLGRELDLVHCANSGAVLGQPLALGEGHVAAEHVMVRPGIMAYGHRPDETTPATIDLLPGIELHSRVTFVKVVEPGETVGYGRMWTAPARTQIATIPVGYADGFSRLLSNRGRALIGGRSYPVVGRVCMDQSMLDVGIDADVHVGDEVVLIGPQGEQEITCEEVAALMGTITYEVTCLLTPRVTRIYVG